MPGKRGIDDVSNLIIVTTGCLCLLILVLGTLILAYLGKITSEIIGKVGGAGIGAGLLGFGVLSVQVIRIARRR